MAKDGMMYYAIIKDNRIEHVVSTVQGESGVKKTIEFYGITGATYQEIPHVIKSGDDVGMYDKKWNRKPTSQLVSEGYITLTDTEKLDGEEIVPKTDYDLVTEGVRELTENEYIDGQEVKTGTDDELLAAGRITEAEHTERLAAKVRAERDSILRQEIDPVVTNPLRWDNMSDAEKQVYADKRQALLDVPGQKGFPHKVEWPEL